MPPPYSFQTGVKNTFSVVDYVLFAGMLLVSAGIGLFYAIKDRNKKNTKDFLLAGGNMSAIPVSLSLLARGAAHITIPIFYRLKVTSVYEYLEIRFGKVCRTCASLTFVLQMVLYMSIVLYAPSLALNAVTGFTLWGSIWTVGLVCTFYTTLGGMKAVLWTDTFQVGMMFMGLVAVLIQGSIELGGFSKAWEMAEKSNRVIFDDFNPDPIVRHSFWSLVIGSTFVWGAVYGTNQAQVQRAITCPTLKKAQIAYWMNFPGLCLILFLCCLIGIEIYAFYSTCDPKTFELITASDQLLPLFVMDILGHVPGIPGLFVACIFSGALSTLSSGLNSIAAVILKDIVEAYFFKDLSEKRATYVSKGIATIFGFLCIGLTYVAAMLGSVLQAALALFGVIGGPLLGVFILGMIFPWANEAGAVSGLLTSLVFMMWVMVGYQVHKPPVSTFSLTSLEGCNFNLSQSVANVTQTTMSSVITTVTEVTTEAARESNMFDRLYQLSYLWYSATAVLVVVGVGLIISFMTGPKKGKDVDPALICPIVDIFLPFLPESIRRPMRFGVKHPASRDLPTSESRAPLKTVSSADMNGVKNEGFTEKDFGMTLSSSEIDFVANPTKTKGQNGSPPPSYDESGLDTNHPGGFTRL
ncbi:hypothetical protein ScPMuIL_004828 [Solemya velum]